MGGRVAHRKTTPCMAIVDVNKEDNGQLNKLVETVKVNYNERADEIKKHWGGSTRAPSQPLGSTSSRRPRPRKLAFQNAYLVPCFFFLDAKYMGIYILKK